MPLTLLLRVLAVCACLLLALPAWGATEDETAPPSAAAGADAGDAAANDAGSVAEAEALMDGGRFMEAVAILGPLVQGRVIHADTLFLYALATMGAAQQAGVAEDTRDALLDQAIASLHAMLVKAPGLVRVRLELARAFLPQGRARAGAAPLRGGARRRRAGGGGRQRPELPRPDQGA